MDEIGVPVDLYIYDLTKGMARMMSAMFLGMKLTNCLTHKLRICAHVSFLYREKQNVNIKSTIQLSAKSKITLFMYFLIWFFYLRYF